VKHGYGRSSWACVVVRPPIDDEGGLRAETVLRERTIASEKGGASR